MEYAITWTFGVQGYRLHTAFPTFKDISDIVIGHAEAGNLDKLLKMQVRNNVGDLVNVLERDKSGELVYIWANMTDW